MTLLERLRELNGSGFQKEGEPFIVWIDRISEENGWVRGQLPVLLEAVEAGKWVRETTNHAYVLNQAAVKGALKRLDAIVDKLEEVQG